MLVVQRILLPGLLAFASTAPTGANAGGDVASVAFVSIRSGDPQIYTRDRQGHVRAITQGKSLPAQPAWASNNRLAYVARLGVTTRIFVTDEAGLSPQRLTDDERSESSPSWSPDGRALAYFSQAIEGSGTELRVVDLATRRTTVVARDEREMGPTPPSWSADGTRLAFSLNDTRNRSHAWVVQRDGSGLRNMTAKYSQRGAAWPNLSPDGLTLLWVADQRERSPIVATSVESGESRDLTPAAFTGAEAARWSPNGRQIVFAGVGNPFEQGRNDIFVMDADGGNVRNLTRHPGEDFDPKWSPDGRSVVFASLRSGTSLLYEVSLFNGTIKPVSEHASHDLDHMVQPLAMAK